MNIFSNPTTNIISYELFNNNLCANYTADDPDAQLLFVLNIGIPVIPTLYITFCPQHESPYTYEAIAA